MRGLVVALLVVLATAHARAESDDTIHSYIVLVGQDTELTNALEDLFFADNTGVKPIGNRVNPPLAELGPVSRVLADSHQGSATVWLSPTTSGATLVTYDRGADRFVVREVPYPLPLNATQAAETARMIRTMLRALRNADDEGAVTTEFRRTALAAPPQLVASIGLGAWFGAPEAAAAPMTTLAVAWRPHGLGAAVSAALAPETTLETMSFRGEASDTVIAAGVRNALRVTSRLRVTPGLGLALHVVSLDGRFGGGDTVRSRRYDPALQISTLAGISLARRVELGVGVSADCLLRRQRYAAGTERILDVSRIQGMLAIVVGVRL